MTRPQLRRLLSCQAGTDRIAPGYDHALFSVRVPQAWAVFVAALLRDRRADIEAAYRRATGDAAWSLLPHVCLARPHSVVVAVPFGTSVNVVGEVIEPMLEGTGAQVPSWA